MDLSTLDRTPRTHRQLIAWFSSPRVAVRSAVRLADTVPSVRVRIRSDHDHGAEGPLVSVVARIPWLWSTMVARQLSALGVAVKWDAQPDDVDTRSLR
jgi:hypothetical protein